MKSLQILLFIRTHISFGIFQFVLLVISTLVNAKCKMIDFSIETI